MSANADTQAFIDALQAHRGILYKVAQVYCQRREDRADLIQDIVTELWRAWPRYRPEQPVSTWMHRISVNVAISHFRGESRRIRDAVDIDTLALDLAAADQVMDAAAVDLAALHQLISRLDAINRALILLYLEGYGLDAIAELLGLSTSNVGTRIQRIKQRLQRSYAVESST